MSKKAILFLVGAVLGATLDGFHTWSGTLSYPSPVFLKMAWWVPPVFGAATLSIADGTVKADSFLRRPFRKVARTEVAAGLALFIAVYYASGFWQADTLTKTWTFSLVAAALWVFSDGTWQGSLQAAVTAIIGCAFENALSSTGAFAYSAPDIARIPFWLAPVYLCAAIAVGNLGRKVLKRVE